MTLLSVLAETEAGHVELPIPAFFFGLTLQLYIPAFICGALAIAAVLWWMWDSDPAPLPQTIDIGGGIRLPAYVSGPMSHSWWAMIVLTLVAGALFACLVFSYLFLWLAQPAHWPTAAALPGMAWPLLSGALYAASGGALAFAAQRLPSAGERGAWPFRLLLLLAVPLLAGAVCVEIAGQRATGLNPVDSAYAAAVYAFCALNAFFAATLAVMALFTTAKSFAGRIDAVRRVTFDNTRLLWNYAVAQGLIGLAVVHIFPRVAG